MAIYVGVNGVPKEVSEIYVGVNGKPKEVSDVYGGKNNVATAVYSGVKPGETIFTSSGTFTVPKKITKIDVFCVGGGGSGGGAYGYANSNNVLFVGQGGDGGGGGYTKTVKNISVTPGQTISVTIGAGANVAPFDGTYYNKATEGLPGGDTSVVGICSAAGGSTYSDEYKSNVYNNGGSGGGAGSYFSSYQYTSYIWAAAGGSDGGNSPGAKWYLGSNYKFSWEGNGQGTTTRYFGESNGTLYAGGGGGGGAWWISNDDNSGKGGTGGAGGGGNGGNFCGNIKTYGTSSEYKGKSGTAGTGGGGGGNGVYYEYGGNQLSKVGEGLGGSGIAIIRWSK